MTCHDVVNLIQRGIAYRILPNGGLVMTVQNPHSFLQLFNIYTRLLSQFPFSFSPLHMTSSSRFSHTSPVDWFWDVHEYLHAIHRLTLPKGVYSSRYFLYPMGIPNLVMHIFILPNPFCCLLMHVCIFIAIRPDLPIPGTDIECLIAILRQNAHMHEQILKWFSIMNTCISRFDIGCRKYLNEYSFTSVSLWIV